MSNKKYWVWLQQVLGAGAKIDQFRNELKSAKLVYEMTPFERYYSGVFTKRQLEKMDKFTLEEAEKIIISCEECGCQILTYEDEDYPKNLLLQRDAPLVLYYQGDVKLLNSKLKIAMVGTRNATLSGLTATYRTAGALVKNDITVVSGGAIGIDGASHLGAVDNDGKTIVVMGCGFGATYHDSTETLRERILEKGLIITEYIPNTAPLGRHFPVRNRIVASLCDGLVVSECPTKSGSMITVDLALKYEKNIFAIPVNVIDESCSGAIELIKNKSAMIVCSPSDILKFYENSDKFKYEVTFPALKSLYEMTECADFSVVTRNKVVNKVPPQPEKEEKPFVQREFSDLTDTEKTVYSFVTEEPKHVDKIIREIESLSSTTVFLTLMQLECDNLVVSDSGKNYRKK